MGPSVGTSASDFTVKVVGPAPWAVAVMAQRQERVDRATGTHKGAANAVYGVVW
jgi:hypothetical protein